MRFVDQLPEPGSLCTLQLNPVSEDKMELRAIVQTVDGSHHHIPIMTFRISKVGRLYATRCYLRRNLSRFLNYRTEDQPYIPIFDDTDKLPS